jgi:hypothetical protein
MGDDPGPHVRPRTRARRRGGARPWVGSCTGPCDTRPPRVAPTSDWAYIEEFVLPHEAGESCMLPLIAVLPDDLREVCERRKVLCGDHDIEPAGSIGPVLLGRYPDGAIGCVKHCRVFRPSPRCQNRLKLTSIQDFREHLSGQPGGTRGVGCGRQRLEQADLQKKPPKPLLLRQPRVRSKALA